MYITLSLGICAEGSVYTKALARKLFFLGTIKMLVQRFRAIQHINY